MQLGQGMRADRAVAGSEEAMHWLGPSEGLFAGRGGRLREPASSRAGMSPRMRQDI